jgi:hypothetical protein
MSRLASSRFRRRAGWVGALVAIAGAVALVVVLVGNTGHAVQQHFVAGKPAVVPPAPKPDVFTAAERRQVRAVAARFVESAVYRRHVDDSWAITTAQLHQGISRADWAGGEIPVVPYSADAVAEVRWKLDYSYAKDVALKVAFYPKPGSGAARQIFEIELENHGTDVTPNWLVSYWAPAGGPQLQSAQPGGPKAPVVGVGRGQLGAVWLFAPVGLIFGGLLGVIVFVVVRARVRRTRAERLYTSRTSPS